MKCIKIFFFEFSDFVSLWFFSFHAILLRVRSRLRLQSKTHTCESSPFENLLIEFLWCRNFVLTFSFRSVCVSVWIFLLLLYSCLINLLPIIKKLVNQWYYHFIFFSLHFTICPFNVKFSLGLIWLMLSNEHLKCILKFSLIFFCCWMI